MEALPCICHRSDIMIMETQCGCVVIESFKINGQKGIDMLMVPRPHSRDPKKWTRCIPVRDLLFFLSRELHDHSASKKKTA